MDALQIMLRSGFLRGVWLPLLLAGFLGAVVLSYSVEELDKLDVLLPLSLTLYFLLLLTAFVYNQFHIRQSLARIRAVFDRLAGGELPVSVAAGDAEKAEAYAAHLDRRGEILGVLPDGQGLDGSARQCGVPWDASADAIILADAQNVIRCINPAATAVFGYAPDELAGRDMGVLFPRHLRGSLGLGFMHRMQSPGYRNNQGKVELPALHKSGREIPLEVSFGHWKLSGTDWFVGIFRDISHRDPASITGTGPPDAQTLR